MKWMSGGAQCDNAAEPYARRAERAVAELRRLALLRLVLHLGSYPIVTFEKQVLNMMGNLV
jgi:hypothetical protein